MLKELALLFFRLGITAFGGPAAHISMMEEEVVKRRQWLTHEQFLDLLGATNIIPGPNSTEMAIHIGFVRAGWRGLVIAGACFIIPAVVITLFFAHIYLIYGSTPQIGSFIYGIRSSIIAVIAAAVFRLSRPIIKKPHLTVLGSLVVILNLFGADEILLLLSAGVIGLLWNYRNKFNKRVLSLFNLIPFIGTPLMISTLNISSATSGATLAGLGLYFLKIGSILYGSGYVLIAYLQSGLVETRHWLTQTQLLDAIAVGQFTPGPVLSTATFIGYLILGIPGAMIATTGIFLPSFIFVMISSPFIPKLRNSSLASGFLDGVNAASLALMLAVSITLAVSTLTTGTSGILFVLALSVIIIWKVNAAWIVAGSAFLGWVLSSIH